MRLQEISFAIFGWIVSLPLFCQQAPAHSSRPASTAISLAELRAGFRQPPPQARLRCYWWWLNGNTDKPTITHDLEEMKAKGFGGALLVDADGSAQGGNQSVTPGPTFGSPAWVDLYRHALREADRLGLEITLNINSGWNLGGPFVKPGQASKVLTYTREVHSGGHLKLLLKQPPTQNGFYRDIAVLAYPLSHGARLPEQINDEQGDRYTSKSDQEDVAPSQLRFRSAAAETGFSMPDSSAMLNDGTGSQFASDSTYADTRLSDVRNLSVAMGKDGTLTTELPAGEWEFLRVGYTDSDARVSTSSGAWQGLAIDHMSRKAFETYWNSVVEPLLRVAKPYKSLKYLATDSWELGGTNWTYDFQSQFTKLRGYDPILYLPIVAGRIVDGRDGSTRFLTDLRRTVADLIVSEHFDVFAEKAREHGLGVQAESGGPHGAPIDALETFRHAAVPQTEFWSVNPHRNLDHDRFFTKEAASAANIYGRRFVAQEGETSIGPQWSESLATDLKPSFDMAITEGMNRLVWHEFTSSPKDTGLPGQEYFAGTHINPKVTWWNASGAFFTYLNRIQFVMQAGTPINDALYFYGDHVPNFVRLKADDPAGVLPEYDYDVSNEDALLRTIKIQGKELVGPGGVRWSVLILPKTNRVSLPVLQLVRRYLLAGGTVASLPPTSPTGLVDAQQRRGFDALVKEIWQGCRSGSVHSFGKGTVVCSSSGREALVSAHVLPDLKITASDPEVRLAASSHNGLDYVHRRIGTSQVYFLRNASGGVATFTATFRSSGGVELWDAVTGEMKRGALSRPNPDGTTDVPLTLPAYGSTFVLFVQRPSVAGKGNGERVEPLKVTDGWDVSFQRDRGVSSAPRHTKELTSWTTWNDEDVRFFSGTATYSAQFDAPSLEAGERACLRFKDVREIAQVTLNGRPLGTIWANPYMTCVDAPMLKGSNKLTIEVTNLWHNRLLGDLDPKQQIKITQTNIKTIPGQLLPSGLIGPAEWVIYKTR